MNRIPSYYDKTTSPLNISLQRAIDARNCNEVKVLIASGADINHTVNQYLDTMLHKAKDSGIARDLLGYSADIHAKNVFDRTPLHSAVIEGKDGDFVQTLIEHGPEVEARDSKGFTPLYYAVKRKDPDVIKCLVMNDANISSKETFDELSPLCTAMLEEDLTAVKALIKYSLLRNFQDNYTKIIDLHNYYRMKNFVLARMHVDHCGMEILKMKEEKISDEVTLFQMLKSNCVPNEALYKDSKGMEVFTKRSFEILSSNKYPHYHDIIAEKFKSKIQMSTLKNMLSMIRISCANNEHMTLNQDIITVLSKYLYKTSLFNLILASYEPGSNENSQDLTDKSHLKRNVINLAAPSSSTFFKRMKLI